MFQRNTSSRTCIGAFVPKRVPLEGCGLIERQAAAFFANPTPLSLGMDVVTRHVANANFSLSGRWVGD